MTLLLRLRLVVHLRLGLDFNARLRFWLRFHLGLASLLGSGCGSWSISTVSEIRKELLLVSIELPYQIGWRWNSRHMTTPLVMMQMFGLSSHECMLMTS
eukprot:SAG22_NODE_328_length_12271_cov_9.681811_6_plen_99_part_00